MITLYGAGGHCKVVRDILEATCESVDQVVDDNPAVTEFMGLPCSLPGKVYDRVIITIGNCNIRKRIAEKIEVNDFISAIHPHAIVSKFATVGHGTVVMQGGIVQAGTSIGNHCIINTKASVDHDCKVADFVHIASGATVCGEVSIGECSWIGAGAVVKQCVNIGRNCMIGAGAVIIHDVPDGAVVVGNPGRIIRYQQ